MTTSRSCSCRSFLQSSLLGGWVTALALLLPLNTAHAEYAWTDFYGKTWRTLVDACALGSVAARVEELRRQNQGVVYAVVNISLNQYDITEARCDWLIERKLGSYWVTADNLGYTSYGTGSPDACALSGYSDPDTGLCGGSKDGLGMSCSAGANGTNPIHNASSNKFQKESDFVDGGSGLRFERFFNSRDYADIGLGVGWRHTYSSRLQVYFVSAGLPVTAYRPDGSTIIFQPNGGGGWVTDPDVNATLSMTTNPATQMDVWSLTLPDSSVEQYDENGRLTKITNITGRVLSLSYVNERLSAVQTDEGRSVQFGYDTDGRLNLVTLPDSRIINLSYVGSGRLDRVTYPDETPSDPVDNPYRQYLYNEAAHDASGDPTHAHLTGIVDENLQRFATFTYDGQGRATSSKHGEAGGIDLHTLTYGATKTTVRDALNSDREFNLSVIQGVAHSTGQTQPGGAGCGPSGNQLTYDVRGNALSKQDFNGHKSCHAYNSRNLETARIEGLGIGVSCPADVTAYIPTTGTTERKILTEWDTRFRLPTKITQDGRETSIAYDSHGNVTSRSVKDLATNEVRTWATTYTYHASVPGVLVQKIENGPRIDVSDLTTTDYYAPDATCTGGGLGCRGQVWKITNALGHVTTFNSYDANGRLIQMTDPNGLVTTLTYWARGWLKTRTVGTEVDSFDYDKVGQLIKHTRPDGSFVRYEYDDAHRLTDIVLSDDSRLHYTLDNAGNRIGEEIRDVHLRLRRSG